MKNKAIFLLPIALTSIVLSGCKSKEVITKLQYGQMIENDVEYINYLTFKEKMENKETFLLTVYAKTCRCWGNFHVVLKDYIAETHVRVYAIDYNEFQNADNPKTYGLNIANGFTSFAIVNQGKLTLNLKSGDDLIFERLEEFKSLMEKMVQLPKMFYISKEQLDTLRTSDKTSAIYFSRSNCSDCGYFEPNFLDNYEATNNLYIVDCETIGVREYDSEGHLTEESQAKWNAFKAEYGLASTNNPKYGFDSGYVPSLQLIKYNTSESKVEYLSGAVYFNDTIAKVDNKFVVEDSYYTQERLQNLTYLNNFEGTKVLKGLELQESDVTYYPSYEMYAWKKESAAKYHNPLAKAFLDDSLPQVTHTGF